MNSKSCHILNLLRAGYRFDNHSHTQRMRYKQKRPVTPKAASSFACGRNLKQLMMTRYVSALVLEDVSTS